MGERVVVGSRPLPVGLVDLAEWARTVEAEHPGGYLVQVAGHIVAIAGEGHDPVTCWCARCAHVIADGIYGPMPDEDTEDAEGDPDGAAATGDLWAARLTATSHMYLCPDCGNKRCPRATWHGYGCTGSNDPGQPGSAYAPAPVPLTVPLTGDQDR